MKLKQQLLIISVVSGYNTPSAQHALTNIKQIIIASDRKMN